MKWYVFNDKEVSSLVNLILDHIPTARVTYNSSNDNSVMKEAKDSLESDTKEWKNVARLITGSPSNVWGVNRFGNLNNYYASYTIFGVRPVVTVSKSLFQS